MSVCYVWYLLLIDVFGEEMNIIFMFITISYSIYDRSVIIMNYVYRTTWSTPLASDRTGYNLIMDQHRLALYVEMYKFRNVFANT